MIAGRTEDLEAQIAELTTTNEDLAGALAAGNEKLDAALARIGAIESQAQDRPDTAAVAAGTKASVFTVSAGQATGSAWVVAQSGGASHLITNYHVISDVWNAGDATVQLHEGEQQWDARILDVSEGTDVALLEVQASFPVLERAPAVPSVGDPVLVVGSPLGLDDSVSTGIVSAIRTEGFDDYIQFSAPVSPGSSGGPLVDDAGRVVGVTVMKAVVEGAEGLGFAIPIGVVCGVVTC